MSVASLWERRLAYILTLGVIPLYRRNGLGTYLYIYIYIHLAGCLAVWLSGCLSFSSAILERQCMHATWPCVSFLCRYEMSPGPG
jgi:hypothetical protein